MRAKYTITLEVDDGSIPVQLKEPGMLTKIEIGQSLPAMGPNTTRADLVSDPNFADFLKKMVRAVSDFPVPLLDELPDDQFHKLTNACSDVLHGDDPTTTPMSYKRDQEEEQQNPFEDLDLGADGTVDTDDWR